jgi:predicted metal-dependent hydrolase
VLPEYTIRESARAKHVRFRVTMSDGLTVVIPKGFDRRRIPGMLEEKRDWVDRALKEIAVHRAAQPSLDHRPAAIELPAIGQSWHLDWVATAKANVSIAKVAPSRLRLSGSIADRAAWRSTLRRWLIERGREHLIPWTKDLSRELGIPIHRISIRCQKTRWGSYTAREGAAGTISLNAQLLFLPDRLVRYVIMHELCHAMHPNHSPSFWSLVRTHEPDADRLRKELRDSWSRVPAWLHQAPR